jgi:hypothetical protein
MTTAVTFNSSEENSNIDYDSQVVITTEDTSKSIVTTDSVTKFPISANSNNK